MSDSGSLVGKISFGYLNASWKKVQIPNRDHGGVGLLGDVPTDFINRICSGLAGHFT